MLPNYKGPLSLSQLAETCAKAIKNANELLDESEILFERDHFARSLYLLRISNEELGKFYLSLEAILFELHKIEINWQTFWFSFRRHELKTQISESFFSHMIENDLYRVSNEELPKSVLAWEHVKLSSLYVDIFENQIQLPRETITKELVSEAIEVMSRRLRPLQGFDINAVIEKELSKIQ